MPFVDTLMGQLSFYHNATDISLQVLDEEGNIMESFGKSFSYCEIIREACGKKAFCSHIHCDGCKQAADLAEGYVFLCPAGLVHFAVPVLIHKQHSYSILAGPVALEYPDISVIDNIIQTYGCSLNYRNKLYTALNAIPIVEPVRMQYLNQLLYALVDNLVQARFYIAEPVTASDDTVEDKDFLPNTSILKNALRYIDKHYRENVRLDEVANYVGLNSSYFSTIFKKEMKIIFSQYITGKRIEEACRLLKNTNMSLVAIASELGFDNQSYFSRSFKKHIGMSPKKFRHET